VLSPSDYLNYSLKYMEEIVKKIQFAMHQKNKKIPIILFTKSVGGLVTEMAKTGCDALGIDWTLSLKDALQLTGQKVALQGNIDPAVLYAEPDIIRQQVALALASYGQLPGHIFNLGHGMNPDMDPEKVAVLVECVHRLSMPYHQPQVVTCP